MNKKEILNSIFYPRKSFIPQDDNDLLIKMSDEVSIGARLFLKNDKCSNIIFFHGNAELAQEYGPIARMFNEANLNFIVVDYRGYGLSEGFPSKENLHQDAVEAFDYLVSYLRSKNYNGQIIAMGRSLGSASICEIISKRIKFLDKCIIESGFGTEYPLLKLLNIDPESIDYTPADGFGNLGKLKDYKKPIYFIHADRDHIIPISEAEMMLKSCASNEKDLLVVNGADHNNIISIMGREYFNKINIFINEQ